MNTQHAATLPCHRFTNDVVRQRLHAARPNAEGVARQNTDDTTRSYVERVSQPTTTNTTRPYVERVVQRTPDDLTCAYAERVIQPTPVDPTCPYAEGVVFQSPGSPRPAAHPGLHATSTRWPSTNVTITAAACRGHIHPRRASNTGCIRFHDARICATHMFRRCTRVGDARGPAIDAAPDGGLDNVAVHWHAARSTARVIGTGYPGCAAPPRPWAVEYNRFAVKRRMKTTNRKMTPLRGKERGGTVGWQHEAAWGRMCQHRALDETTQMSGLWNTTASQ